MVDFIYKYPKTPHLPWSPNLQNDDRRIESLESLLGQEVIVTEKMDGENTNMYNDHIHARSPMPLVSHPSRNRIKELHDRIKRDIPHGWRICGENCYAKHSIHYENLPGYFLVFGIWNKEICLSWDDTIEWCQLLNLPTVPVLWTGTFTEKQIKQFDTNNAHTEGYVVRVARSFTFNEFPKVCAKYVRTNHVQTSKHWMLQPIIENTLET
jgi:hypothetical protein